MLRHFKVYIALPRLDITVQKWAQKRVARCAVGEPTPEAGGLGPTAAVSPLLSWRPGEQTHNPSRRASPLLVRPPILAPKTNPLSSQVRSKLFQRNQEEEEEEEERKNG